MHYILFCKLKQHLELWIHYLHRLIAYLIHLINFCFNTENYNLSYCFREVIDLLIENRVLIKSLATNPSIHYEHRNKIYDMNN